MFQPDLFKNRTAIITGGGTGIGLAIARMLGSSGAHVVIASRKMENLAKGAEALQEAGIAHTAVACNIRKREEVETLIDAVIRDRGGIDYVVNNAGGQFALPAEQITPNGWHSVVETNLYGPWNMIQTVANKWMIPDKRGGRFVNILMANLHGFPGMAHSAAARGGVANLTMTLAVEWAKHNIRINSIALGTVDSAGLDNYPKELNVRAWASSNIPMARLVKEQEVAALVCYLLSPLADAMNGAVIPLDGGEYCFNGRWPLQ